MLKMIRSSLPILLALSAIDLAMRRFLFPLPVRRERARVRALDPRSHKTLTPTLSRSTRRGSKKVTRNRAMFALTLAHLILASSSAHAAPLRTITTRHYRIDTDLDPELADDCAR